MMKFELLAVNLKPFYYFAYYFKHFFFLAHTNHFFHRLSFSLVNDLLSLFSNPSLFLFFRYFKSICSFLFCFIFLTLIYYALTPGFLSFLLILFSFLPTPVCFFILYFLFISIFFFFQFHLHLLHQTIHVPLCPDQNILVP